MTQFKALLSSLPRLSFLGWMPYARFGVAAALIDSLATWGMLGSALGVNEQIEHLQLRDSILGAEDSSNFMKAYKASRRTRPLTIQCSQEALVRFESGMRVHGVGCVSVSGAVSSDSAV